MSNINTSAELKARIVELQVKKNNDEELIRTHFHEIVEMLKPANLLKTTVSEVSDSMHFKKNILNIALGLGAGYLSRKLVIGNKAAGIGKQILGSVLEFGISNFVAKQSSEMNTSVKPGKGFFSRLFTKA
ncbi:MAG: hypothetical protein NVSMB45_17550 [Ginsengibacter sp.]